VIGPVAVCPATPLLARELSGRAPALAELREACADAVRALVSGHPPAVIVVGPAAQTAEHDPSGQLDLSGYAPALGSPAGPALPSALGLGARLLDEAGWDGPRVLQSVAATEPAAACAALGARLAQRHPSAALLIMGDGSARRSPTAPGHFDERALDFDALVGQAITSGDTEALKSLDPALAEELMATGRPVWQVLAGAVEPGRRGDLRYADAPLGVGYLVIVAG
jgi:hypothetical protein